MDYSYGYDPYVTSGVSTGSSIFAGLLLIIYLVSIIGSLISLIAMWKIFTKAGKPGWAVIVPIYNIVVLFEIIELEWWHVLIALFVPFAVFIYIIIIDIKLAKVFGKGTGFTLLLIFIPVVGQLMLAFGNATYNGQVGYSMNSGMSINGQNNMNMNNMNGMNNTNNMMNNNMNNTMNNANNTMNNNNTNVFGATKDYSTMNVNNTDHYYNAELDHMSQKQINEMVKNNMQMEQNNVSTNNQLNNQNTVSVNNTTQNNQVNIAQQEQMLDNQTGIKSCPVCGSNQVATARECSMCGHKFM